MCAASSSDFESKNNIFSDLSIASSDVIIIGAGPAGLTAAYRLEKTGKQKTTVLECNNWVGGKCSSVLTPEGELATERGGFAIRPNASRIFDIARELEEKIVSVLPIEEKSLDIHRKMEKMSFGQRIVFVAQIIVECYRFQKTFYQYRNLRDSNSPLPPLFEKPIGTFCKAIGASNVGLMLKPLVAGFGYGSMEHCAAFNVLEYMGESGIPYLIVPSPLRFVVFSKGSQHLMQNIADSLRDVRTGIKIQSIVRNSNAVLVTYLNNQGCLIQHFAKKLVIAINPTHWKELNIRDLTPVEKRCINEVDFHRYPVVVCKIAGIPAEHKFMEIPLGNRATLALITTADKRKLASWEPRVFTAYINLPHGTNNFCLDKPMLAKIKNALESIPGASHVKILEYRIWSDYMSSLSWDLRVALDKEQNAKNTNTTYIGSYIKEGFELIDAVTRAADKVVQKYLLKMPTPSCSEKFFQKTRQAHYFLWAGREKESKSPLSCSERAWQKTNQFLSFFRCNKPVSDSSSSTQDTATLKKRG